jgi:hypothetical protein
MIILALILAATVYGFAASNSMPASTYAGEGQTSILGYTVSNVVYGLTTADSDPSDIDQVTFDLNAAASSAYVSFDGGTSWDPCSISGGTAVTCSGLSVGVDTAATFAVIAVD